MTVLLHRRRGNDLQRPIRVQLSGRERQLSARPHPKECTRVFISTAAAAAHMNDSGKQEHRSELTSRHGLVYELKGGQCFAAAIAWLGAGVKEESLLDAQILSFQVRTLISSAFPEHRGAFKAKVNTGHGDAALFTSSELR